MDDQEIRRLRKTFQALGDTTRLGILLFLRKAGEQDVASIVAQFKLAQPTISRHLAVLYSAFLVDRERRGQRVYYVVDSEALDEASALLEELRK